MHFFGSIPFVAVLVASAFAAVSVVWNSDRRPTAVMGAIFACAGLWALLDLLSGLETEPARARFWLGLMLWPMLLLGPLLIALLGRMLPQLGEPLRPLVRVGVGLACVLGLAAWLLPGFVVGASATPWGGWLPQYGPLALVLVPVATILPAVAVVRVRSAAPRAYCERADAARVQAVLWVVPVATVAVWSTDFGLPLMGVASPRLGAITAVVGTAIMWLRVLHAADDLALTPEGMARAMLEELPDGIALVGLEGTILSSNSRLAAIVGRRDQQLVGRPLERVVGRPLDTILSATPDLEMTVPTPTGAPVPVSISSCLVHDRRGDEVGVVVVVRDQRHVDGLRRRLMASGRLAALGELAAGIAHEVNNPVAFIRSDLNFLAERLQELGETEAEQHSTEERTLLARGPERIEKALARIERIAEVVDDVRGFAHMGEQGQTSGDPAALLEGAIRLARLERRGEVEMRLETGDFAQRVARGQELKQILLALLRVLALGTRSGGGVDAALSAQSGRLHVDLRAEQLAVPAASYIERFESLRSGGLESAHDELDLAIASELVEQMGGEILLDAAGPEDLCVGLRLPLDSVELAPC